MRVLYAWDADYPWDVRTEKICLALRQGGHHVVIAARNINGNARTELRPEGVVERLPAWPPVGRRLLSFPVPLNPVWLSHLNALVHRHTIDLIIVRDLPLAPTALLAGRGRCPIIMDMAENYPAMIHDIWTDRRQRPLDLLVRNPTIVAAVERAVIGRMSHVMTVVEESRDRVVRLGVPRARTSVVSNTPPLSRVTTAIDRAPGVPLRLIYLGLVEAHRGISCMLEAASLLRRSSFPFHLDVVGDGRDLEHFQDYAGALGLDETHVTFHGRIAHEAAIKLVARAHVGIVPHESRESWNTTIPNKLFDYMAAGLVVLSSDAIPAARVVRDTGAGLVFPSGNGPALAALVRTCADPVWATTVRHAGQRAIRERYNWERDSRTLLDVVAAVGCR